MRSCFVLLFASLLTSCEAQGTIETPVFVLKGRDLLLKLHDDPPERFLAVEWKINKTVNLVRFNPSGKANVTGRLELGGKNFSVILKNLQEADSGVYSAELVTNQRITIAEYKVTVQGPVSPVELTVDRVDSSSSESCDLHVTCRTHNSHISSTFRCVDRVCSQEGGERSEVTTSGASLHVYLLNTTIICNHSNQVNWTQDLIHAEHLCPSIPDPPLHSGWVAAICIVIVIMFVGLFFWLCSRQRRTIRSRQKLHDKKGTNSSEEAGAESKSLDTTTQTNVQPLQSSDKHETHQSNIKRKTSERSPADDSTIPVKNPAYPFPQEGLDRQWLYVLNQIAALGETMTGLERQWLDHLNKEATSEETMEERDRQWLDHINTKAASGEKMEERDLQLLDLLNKKATLRETMTKLDLQLLDLLTQKAASGEKMTKHDLQLLDHINKKADSGEMMKGLERQLRHHLNKKADSGEMTKRDRQLLNVLKKKKASREKMEELDLQLRDHLNKESASEETMEEHERQWLDLLTQKAASGEKMTKRELQMLDHLTQKAASGEKMEELELLNETNISSSFVKPDAGSIQPESGFGREDSL